MDIAVIGGGAAGLMSSIIAANSGANVTIYEKNNKLGKKILATGNGRCNYTNMNMSIDFYHSKNIEQAEKVLEFFDVKKTLEFFEGIGIYPYIDTSGKVFPNSLQSSSMMDAFRYELERKNIKEINEFEIVDLRHVKDKFSIIGRENIYYADKVILCCGGKSSPQLGSDGQGYNLAKLFGHNIIEPFPALVQLKLKGNFFKKITGVRFDAVVNSMTDKKLIRQEEGEILFTEYGISGPTILQISRMVLAEMNKGEKVYLTVDMFPELSKNMLYDVLNERFSKIGYKNLEDSLIGFINKKLISVILTQADFQNKHIKCETLNKKEIYKLINILKGWKFEVIGYNSWEQSQVTAGGVDLKQVNSQTLESKKIKNLYMAGEILDVDGDCGGYNLQWAWSSGYVAGLFSSKK